MRTLPNAYDQIKLTFPSFDIQKTFRSSSQSTFSGEVEHVHAQCRCDRETRLTPRASQCDIVNHSEGSELHCNIYRHTGNKLVYHSQWAGRSKTRKTLHKLFQCWLSAEFALCSSVGTVWLVAITLQIVILPFWSFKHHYLTS